MAEIEKFHYGNLIKQMLRQKDISVREIAERTGKSTQAVYSILRTESPRIDIVIEISIIIGFKDFLNELILNVDELTESLSTIDGGPMTTKKLAYHEVPLHAFTRTEEKKVPEKIENLNEKILSLEKSLYLAEQVIAAKDELIEHLKIEK